jgi:type IV secretory pathway TraG/TraD family ATPase VirD4
MNDRVGTAEWFPPAEFAGSYPYEEGMFWLGRSPLGGEPIGYIDDRHICLVSGSRSGKGTTTIINNLCLWPGSVVVVDPKGENATVTAARRGPGSKYCEGMGQAVHVLDPFRVAEVDESLRSRFNPLDALNPDDPLVVDEAGRLADAIVVVNKDASEPFWDESARTLVKGLILHVISSPQFEGRRNLVTVRELIARGDHEGVATLRGMGVEDVPSAQGILWEGVSRNPAFGGIVSGIGETLVNMAVNSSRLFESVLQVAHRNTEFLDSPGMRACVSASDFRLSDLKTDPNGVSIYLSLPQRYMPEHYRWLRMMIALIVTEMEAVKGQPACGHRVLLFLDEFAGLKRMEVIENAVAQIAGFGVTLFFVLQSLEQLEKVYGKGWETFLGCSAIKLFFAIDDKFTREYVSRLIGDTELIREVRSHGQTDGTNESDTTGRSRSETAGESASRSTGRTLSVSESNSESVSVGQNRSTTDGTNQSVTKGVNQSLTEGQSESTGWNRSKNTAKNWGTNTSEGQSQGSSHNESWSPPPFFFRNTMRYVPFLRDNETANYGTNQGTNSSRGRSDGGSRGTSKGTSGSTSESTSQTEGSSLSHTDGRSSSTTVGDNHSRTLGRSGSRSEGLSESSSVSQSRSQTVGESDSHTAGRSFSRNEGTAETIQKRPLITADELGVFFDRPSGGRVGWALVLIGGARPAILQRTPYYSDPFFAWLFDPHPDHAPPPELMGEEPFMLPSLTENTVNLLMQPLELRAEGCVVRAGDPIAEAVVCGPKTLYPHISDLYAHLSQAPGLNAPSFNWNGEQVGLNSAGPIRLPIHSPASGCLVRWNHDGEGAVDLSECGILHVNRRRYVDELALPEADALTRYTWFLDEIESAVGAADRAIAQRQAQERAEQEARERAEAVEKLAAELARVAEIEAQQKKSERLRQAETRYCRPKPRKPVNDLIEHTVTSTRHGISTVMVGVVIGLIWALASDVPWLAGVVIGYIMSCITIAVLVLVYDFYLKTMENSRSRKWSNMSDEERERYARSIGL